MHPRISGLQSRSVEDRTPDATPTVDERRERRGTPVQETEPASAFEPPAKRVEPAREPAGGGIGRANAAGAHPEERPAAHQHKRAAQAVPAPPSERAVRITARLEHPGIVPIHDAGRGPDGTP